VVIYSVILWRCTNFWNRVVICFWTQNVSLHSPVVTKENPVKLQFEWITGPVRDSNWLIPECEFKVLPLFQDGRCYSTTLNTNILIACVLRPLGKTQNITVKEKLLLCLRATKWRGTEVVEVILHACSTSAVDGGEGSDVPFGRFTRGGGGESSQYHWIKGWLGPEANRYIAERRKHPCTCRETNPGRSARSVTALWIMFSRTHFLFVLSFVCLLRRMFVWGKWRNLQSHSPILRPVRFQ
jgi:hypothetical protein